MQRLTQLIHFDFVFIFIDFYFYFKRFFNKKISEIYDHIEWSIFHGHIDLKDTSQFRQ